MADTILLTLSGIDIPPYSARGLTQTLDPIDQTSNIWRTWNGALRDLTLPQFRKYRSVISGNDQQAPACDGLWQGRIITVGCTQELAYKTGASGAPFKSVVAGSLRVDGSFTFYRPSLVMMVMNFSLSWNEWAAAQTWSMSLEEV